MAKQKDWYWEAEHDRIAADEGLRLVRSPDGWQSQGLECVGLWFLMVNQMWRSPRVGYLCDPVLTHLPLKTTELAAMVGRDVQVVERVQQVLMERNFFSKTPEGIIFSRGIIRKEAMRKKRASAGRKGGKALQGLLRQNASDVSKHPISLGIGINSNSSLGSEVAINLAQKAAFLSGKGHKPDVVSDWHAHISDLLAAGISAEAIDRDIDKNKGLGGEKKAEPPWDFKDRILAENGKSAKRRSAKGTVGDGARTAMDWASEGEK